MKTARVRPIGPIALLVVGVLVVVVACVRPPSGPPLPTTTAPTSTPPRPPNIVRILTDDQDMSSLAVMTKTQQLLAAKGVNYTNAMVGLSLCCPSRTTHLTGQYSHNHNVWDNVGTNGGYPHFDHPENSLAPWLKAAGYSTAHVGKYLNGYDTTAATQVPAGWDDWLTVIDPPNEPPPYYGYTVSDNGVARTYGTADTDYLTDVLADRAVNEVHTMAASGQPFFLDYWPTAPHYGRGRVTTSHFGPVAAPRHELANAGVTAPRGPNFLPASDTIPPGLTAFGTKFEQDHGGTTGFLDNLDGSYRDYVNSLLAVDESVERLVNELSAQGQLDNTLIIFTSDNGLMWGNHGLTLFKWEPYEESVRVPLIIRGPGFPAGVTSSRPVSNVDIVPTILQATGVAAGRVVDGKPLLPYPSDPATDSDRALLIESNMYDPSLMYQFPSPFPQVPRFKGVRTGGFQYTEWFDGTVELFDLQQDPAEMHNVAAEATEADNRAKLSAAVAQLSTCVGAACNVSVTGLTHPVLPATSAASASSPTVRVPSGATGDVDMSAAVAAFLKA